MCNTPRYKAQNLNKWNCSLCTFENESMSKACQICNASKPILPLFKQCDHLMRLLYAMKYYQLLDIINGPSNIEIFTSFLNEVYPNMIDDYHHVISNHEKHLQQIHEEIMSDANYGPCDYSQCKLSERYRRKQLQPSPKLTDHKISVFCDILEAFHHWTFHMYHSGMRVKKLDQAIAANQFIDEAKKENKYVDYEFKRVKESITNQTEEHSLMDHRFTANNNNKFQLQVSTNSADAKITKNETFVDLFLMTVDRESVSPAISKRLLAYMIAEGFDSDGLIADVDAQIKDSNILRLFDESYAHSLIRRCFEDLTMPTGFSTGFIWFYWKWYKGKKEIVNSATTNENDYGGYQMEADQLFVPQKHGSYKEELLNHFSIKQFQNMIMPKADALMASSRVKKIKANFSRQWLYYGIQSQAPITINHIISLITYTDFTDYSSAFSSSFRKTFITESLASIRERNREFWWQSKSFRETIEIYGSYGYDDADDEGGMFRDGIGGPFYSGVSCQLSIPEFAIRLCAPTSTSMHLEVAMKFATKDGIIIQFNNNGGRYGMWLSCFDVSWLSRYPDEDERVWCGGYFPIKVEGVRVMETNKNYTSVFKTLYRFDCMVSGVGVKKENLEEEIEERLPPFDGADAKDIDAYIISTFQSYLKKKKQIIISFTRLSRQKLPQYWKDIILQAGIKSEISERWNLSSDWIYNLLSVTVFKIFPNLKKILIDTKCGNNPNKSYPLNLLHLLDVICVSSKWDQVVVQQSCSTMDFVSWIDKIWESKSTLIKQQYEKRGLVIDLERKERGNAYKTVMNHNLIITRKNV